ncbi:hypothetical protein [Halosegnis sp.]|uniref:hypothetical protein n=1 Tax=Halosegnis sp. TaxID=2864959 RepID=UPI0035D4C83A
MRSRLATAVVGLIVSLVISGAVYYYTGSLFIFLVVPFVPLLFRGFRDGKQVPKIRECPQCGFQTQAEYDYCPHDGTPLKTQR